MKQGMEVAQGLQYKLWMMGVLIVGPTYTYGDKMSIIYNTQRPKSTLKKNLNSIGCHVVVEAVAMGVLLRGNIDTNNNVADCLTKVIPEITNASLPYGFCRLLRLLEGTWEQ